MRAEEGRNRQQRGEAPTVSAAADSPNDGPPSAKPGGFSNPRAWECRTGVSVCRLTPVDGQCLEYRPIRYNGYTEKGISWEDVTWHCMATFEPRRTARRVPTRRPRDGNSSARGWAPRTSSPTRASPAPWECPAATDGEHWMPDWGGGDTLVVAALDRIGRRSLDIQGAILDLNRRGVRIRTLAADQRFLAQYLDADPDTPERAFGSVLVALIALFAQMERDAISRRTRAGLERAKSEG